MYIKNKSGCEMQPLLSVKNVKYVRESSGITVVFMHIKLLQTSRNTGHT